MPECGVSVATTDRHHGAPADCRSSLELVLLWPWHVSDRRGDNGQRWPCEQMLMLRLARLVFLSALIKSCYHCYTVLCRRPHELWHLLIILLWLTFHLQIKKTSLS